MVLIYTTLFAAGIKTKSYNPGTNAIFPVTSTIIYGERDAYLVDAQFQKQYAEALVKEIRALKKNLKIVYISHSDPDYYFGLDVIKKNFPQAQIVSTAQTAYLINASKDEKMAVWKDQLKADAPSELIVPQAIDKLPDLEGNKIEIKYNNDDNAHSYLWIPETRTILGGISVSQGTHVWIADTQTPKALENWIKLIRNMKALNPRTVIPSHYVKADYSPENLDFMQNYLSEFKTASKMHNDASKIIEYLEHKFPNLAGKDELVLGAKVFTGEMKWDLKNPYPVIGHYAVVNFGAAKFQLNYKDNKNMTFKGIEGTFKDDTDNVQYNAVEVAPNVFMVYWHEPKSGSNVVHVQDFNKNEVYTNIAAPDGSFTNLKGTISIME